MHTSARLGLVCCTALCLAACMDTVVLRDGADGLALTYRCDRIVPHALSTSERTVVRRYGAELLKSESGLGGDRTTALVTADDRQGWDRFEQLVVEALCERPAIADGLSLSPAPTRYTFPKSGEPAPEFILPVLTPDYPERTTKVSLADLRGRYVVLTFWSSWCVPCRDEYPELVQLEGRFGDRGLTVLGVVYRDSPSNALAFAADQELGRLRTLLDEGGAVARAYRVRGIPETVVIAPNGAVVDYMVGWFPAKGEELARRFDNVLPPAPDDASVASDI